MADGVVERGDEAGVSEIHFALIEGCEEPYVQFFVDRQDFGQRVRAALGEDGFDDVLPWCGGDYSIEETVLGERVRSEGGENLILFACGCSHMGCSSVHARVRVT